MKDYDQDDKGNKSSFRKVFVPLMYTVIITLAIILVVFVLESFKDTPNYNGIAQFASAIFGGGVITLIAKAIQKKFEI